MLVNNYLAPLISPARTMRLFAFYQLINYIHTRVVTKPMLLEISYLIKLVLVAAHTEKIIMRNHKSLQAAELSRDHASKYSALAVAN